MKLAYWMYAGPAHIGTLRVASSFKNVHAIMHAPLGDDYFNVMRSMLERERDFTPVTASIVDRHVLARGSQEKVVENITRKHKEESPDLVLLTPTCTSSILQEDLHNFVERSTLALTGEAVPVNEGKGEGSLGSPEGEGRLGADGVRSVALGEKEYNKDTDVILADVNHYRVNELQAADRTLEQIVRFYIEKAKKEKALDIGKTEKPSVNIIGIFTLGFHNSHDCRELKRLFNDLGVVVNEIIPEGGSVHNLKNLPRAWFNFVPYREVGLMTAVYLKSEFDMPYISTTPMGLVDTSLCIREIGEIVCSYYNKIQKDEPTLSPTGIRLRAEGLQIPPRGIGENSLERQGLNASFSIEDSIEERKEEKKKAWGFSIRDRRFAQSAKDLKGFVGSSLGSALEPGTDPAGVCLSLREEYVPLQTSGDSPPTAGGYPDTEGLNPLREGIRAEGVRHSVSGDNRDKSVLQEYMSYIDRQTRFVSGAAWFARSIDCQNLTGKKAVVFGDATHAAAMTKILSREMGIRVSCAGTYCKHDADWFREQVSGFCDQILITDDHTRVGDMISLLEPAAIFGTQMERHVGKRLDIPCGVISAPVHIQNFPLGYRPFLGYEGANQIADLVYNSFSLGMEDHLLQIFGGHDSIPDASREQKSVISESSGLSSGYGVPEGNSAVPKGFDKRSLGSLHKEQSSLEVTWSVDGSAELNKVPGFVRGKVKRNTEKYALQNKITEITVEVMYAAKEAMTA